jgi:hypothetical protein
VHRAKRGTALMWSTFWFLASAMSRESTPS